jgi:hypothetical protein
VNAFDDLDARLIDQSVEDRMVAGRRIEEDIFDAGRLELRDEQRAAAAFDIADTAGRRGGGRIGGLLGGFGAHRRQILRKRICGNARHPERAQARHQLAPRQSVIEILLD